MRRDLYCRFIIENKGIVEDRVPESCKMSILLPLRCENKISFVLATEVIDYKRFVAADEFISALA